MEISAPLECFETKKKRFEFLVLIRALWAPVGKQALRGSKCSTWTEIILPCFLVRTLLGCVEWFSPGFHWEQTIHCKTF